MPIGKNGTSPATMNAAFGYDHFSASILIVDDHPAVRSGLKNLISSRPGWLICGEAADGEQAVAMALELKPSAIVMDISMPRMDGLEATRRIRSQLPNVEILIVSQHDSDDVVSEAQKAGARGFVVKSHLSADLLPALEAALLHSSRISAPVSRAWQDASSTARPRLLGEVTDPGPHDDLDLMSGGGETGALIRAHKWSITPFGPVSAWPQALRTAVRICLDSRFPIVIFWGSELRLLYNDAYLPALGTTKHPRALGSPGREVWSEIWDTVGPMLEGVMRTGQATWESDQLLLFDRHGYMEETYWTYSYSAIRLSSGDVGGVFTAVHEVTDQVLSARRLKTLREVADQAVQAKNELDACYLAMQSIVRNAADCPYAMIFLCAGTKATRVAASFEADTHIPATVDLAQADDWGIRQALQSRTPEVIAAPDVEFLPVAPFGAKCRQAISIPILGPLRDPIAVITIGVSPYRALDSLYLEFFESLARNLAANINNARAYHEERKRAEALAELDRAKTAFFSNVSHEFRTPLTLMLGPLEDVLAARDQLPIEHRERLEVAHRNSLRLLKLVNTLLDFSRIEAGRMQASYEPTDLATLTAELSSVFRSTAERAGLKLLISCPPLAEPVYVDREMWEKIVFNLLSNAFKFTFAGEIEVSLRPVPGAVELSVRDTGTGVPAAELPHLFERFYRVRNAAGRTFEGSGIGLALVQELAKLHGGTVGVQSQPDHGSTFTVTIPLGRDHLPADRIGPHKTLQTTSLSGEAYVQEALRWLPASEFVSDELPLESVISLASPVERPQPGKSRARILLADDNADMRDYVRGLLRVRYDVVEAGDGQTALETARQNRPDLILSDVMMPRLDGVGLLRAVRSDEALKNVPVILLSARAGEESRIEGVQSGADDYLVKPFSARELLARVESHLDMARTRRESAERERVLRAEAELGRERFRRMVDELPLAIYCTDAEGCLTYFNKAAVEFSGRAPELGTDRWCVTWKLFRPDGTPLPHDECPMAIALKEGRVVRGCEAIVERPDGTRRWFTPFPTPLHDAKGKIVGGINLLLDITERKMSEQTSNLLAAIVDSSDDAIVSNNMHGMITSWNKGAERIFGYTAQEAIGQYITLIIPSDRRAEESEILARLGRGERIDHFETTRRRKDGSLLDISLTVSPVRDAGGTVVGASKVARDISERKRAEIALQEAARKQQALFRLADHLHRADSLDEVYAAAFDAIDAALGCERASILLFDHQRVMRFVSWRGLSDSYRSALDGHSPWKPDTIDPLPVLVPDVERSDLDAHVKAVVQAEGIQSLAFIPLISAGRLIGKFMMYFGQPHRFDAVELELSGMIARQVAFAIERRRSEEALRQSEERLRQATEAGQLIVWEMDLGTGCVKCSPNATSIWGIDQGTAEEYFARVHPEDQALVRSSTDATRSDNPYLVEYRVIDAHGQTHWLLSRGSFVNGPDGKPSRFTGVSVDLTARKQAEERERQITAEVMAANAKFRAVFEQTTVFAGIMTNEGVIVDANKLFLDSCGYRADEVLGRQFWDTKWWRNFPQSQQKVRAATPQVAKGVPYREILQYSGADGTERLMDFALYPIVNEQGEILFLHPTGVDITELKRVEENYRNLVETLDAEVRARTRELEQRNADVVRQSEQVRDLSWKLLRTQDEERRHIARELHDSAGQTLTVLGLNLAQFVKKAGRNDPELASEAEMIQETVQQLHREIRTTSYLLHPPLLDEAGLSSALQWYVEGLSERSGLEIDLTISSNFGRLPRDMELTVFRLVQECLTNIHRHSGSKRAAIHISRLADSISIEVKDQGQGMSPDKLTEIQSRGSGVGIRGMRERLCQFGGKLNIESDASGTRVLVTIPLRKSGLEEQRGAEPLEAAV